MVIKVKAITEETRGAEAASAVSPPEPQVAAAVPAATSPKQQPQQQRFGFSFLRLVSLPTAEVKDVEIYYGTMFGGAERYARALHHAIQTNCRVRVSVQDLDGFNEAQFARRDRLTKSRLFVFVVSTHFAGAPSPSAQRFCDWLRSIGDEPLASTAPSKENAKVPKGQLPVAATGCTGFFARLSQLFPRRKPAAFAGMNYAVFGHGDSIYLTYNFVGKFLDARLKHLGGTPFIPLGLGDASNNEESSYRKWETALLYQLTGKSTTLHRGLSYESMFSSATNGRRQSSAPQQRSLTSAAVVPASQTHDSGTKITPLGAVGEPPRDTTERVQRRKRTSVSDNFGRPVRLRHLCRIVDDQEVTKGSALERPESRTPSPVPPLATAPRTPRIALFDNKPFAVILPIEFVGSTSSAMPPRGHRLDPPSRSAIFCVRLMNPEATYTTVSTLGVFPQNSPEIVAQVAEAFGYDLDAVIQLSLDDTEHHVEQHQLPFPTPCTIRTALTEFLELRTLNREFLQVAAGFVVTSDEKETLENYASTAGSASYRSEILDKHKGIVELLETVPSLQIPLEVFVNITPTIKPRYFTIGSSSSVSPRDLDLAISLARLGQPEGLAASYFERILHSYSQMGVPIRGFMSTSRFQFLENGTCPLILIAAGTGISPMRAILQERLVRWMQQRASGQPPSTIPRHVVFYGASNEDSIVFRDDLRRWEQQLFIKVHYAFSNDARHPPRYVQDALQLRADDIFQLIGESNTARIFVCGRSAMARAVREVFAKDQALRRNTWFDTMRSSGRYIEESHH